MRLLLLLLLLLCTLVHSHISTSEKEARRAIAAAVKERASLFKTRHGNFSNPNHIEENLNICSDYCKQRVGNGICDQNCKTRGCYEDMGDCPSHPYRHCWEMNCSLDTCNGDCAMSGCENNCEKGSLQQFLLFFSPFLSPSRIFFSSDSIEQLVERKTGVTMILSMIWGIVEGEIEPFARLWPLYPIRDSYNGSISLFRVVEGAFDPHDHKTRRILQRMGENAHVARLVPMMLGHKQAREMKVFEESYKNEKERMKKQTSNE